MSNAEAMRIDLGEHRVRVQARIDSGEYSSADEVIQAGLDALERQEAEFNEILRQKIQEALDDPSPSIPLDEVFERLERKHAALMKAGEREPQG